MSENDNPSEGLNEAAAERLDPSRAADQSRKPTALRRALANDDIVVWVVGVVLFGAVVVWIFR